MRFFLFVLIALQACASMAIDIGDIAPKIIGRELSGDMFSLSSLKDKPKVINFFWVDCEPCKKELPMLSKKERLNPEVEFLAVHAEINFETEANYDIEDIRSFAQNLSSHPSIMILGSNRIKQQYKISAFPATVLLNKDNVVEKVLYGFNEKTVSDLEVWLKEISR